MELEEIYDLPPHEKARALLERGRATRREGRDDLAHGFCTQSLNLFRGHHDRQGEAAALLELADLALHYNPIGEDGFARRRALGEEALSICRELGDKRGTARALRVLASIAPGAEAEHMLQESLALAREEGDQREIAHSLERLGAHYGPRERGKAVALKGDALRAYRDAGNRAGEAQVQFSLAISSLRDPERCRGHAEEALRLYREIGQRKQVALMLTFLAGKDVDVETKIAYLTEARAICRELKVHIWEASSLRHLAEIAAAAGDLVHAQAVRQQAEGIYPERPIDPELLKAFETAAAEESTDSALDALAQMFGGGTRE